MVKDGEIFVVAIKIIGLNYKGFETFDFFDIHLLDLEKHAWSDGESGGRGGVDMPCKNNRNRNGEKVREKQRKNKNMC
jgi:hypothetical protein